MELLGKLTPILTVKQIDRMSNIFDNAGQVFLGVAVLSPLITGFDRINIFVISSGIIAVLICWSVSMLLSRKVENDI